MDAYYMYAMQCSLLLDIVFVAGLSIARRVFWHALVVANEQARDVVPTIQMRVVIRSALKGVSPLIKKWMMVH